MLNFAYFFCLYFFIFSYIIYDFITCLFKLPFFPIGSNLSDFFFNSLLHLQVFAPIILLYFPSLIASFSTFIFSNSFFVYFLCSIIFSYLLRLIFVCDIAYISVSGFLFYFAFSLYLNFLSFSSFPLKYILSFRFNIFQLNYISVAFIVNSWDQVLSFRFVTILPFFFQFLFKFYLSILKSTLLLSIGLSSSITHV